VFQGIKTHTSDLLRFVDQRAQRREAAWDLYQAGKAEEASNNFQASLATGSYCFLSFSS